MEITLRKANSNDIIKLYEIQLASFMPLYEIYHDDETSPAKESMENFLKRLNQPESTHYMILSDLDVVGAIRVREFENGCFHLSQISVLPIWQGKGIAQKALYLMEEMYPMAAIWNLETIMQEKRNCYLYEKMGYRQTGEKKFINEKMTIVTYEKHIKK